MALTALSLPTEVVPAHRDALAEAWGLIVAARAMSLEPAEAYPTLVAIIAGALLPGQPVEAVLASHVEVWRLLAEQASYTSGGLLQ